MFKFRIKAIIITAALGLLVFFHLIGILSPAENFIVLFSKPLLSKAYLVSLSFKNFLEKEREKVNFKNEINILKAQNQDLIAKNSRLEFVEAENKKLRQYLNFSPKNKFNYILANVLYQSLDYFSESGRDSLIIDRGRKSGIEPGLAVVNSHGILVGKIIDVKDSISEISLVTDSNCRLAVSVSGGASTDGIAEGEMGLTIKMNFIPQDKKIKFGDIIVTSGLEKKVPPGLVVGEVTQVNNSSNEVWQNAVVEPLADLDSLDIVSVLMPQN